MAETIHPGVPFLRSQARILTKNKYILFLGDSVQRAMYKDFIALLHNAEMLTKDELKAASENTIRGDTLLYTTDKHNGTSFCEIREYAGYQANITDSGRDKKVQDKWLDTVLVRFAFITKIWDNEDHTKKILEILTEGIDHEMHFVIERLDYFPDVICVNSLFWDVTKWGDVLKENKDGSKQFRQFTQSLEGFCDHVNSLEYAALKRHRILRPTLKIWRSSMPLSRHAVGGFIEKAMENVDLVEDIAIGNASCRPVMQRYGWDLLDAQYWFRQNQDVHRIPDGIHWNAKAHRWLTSIFLSHISEAWGLGYPEMIQSADLPRNNDEVITIKERAKNDVPPKVRRRDLITFEDEHSVTTAYMRPDLTIPDAVQINR